MEEEEDRSHSILKRNKDGSLSPNGSIIVVTITIKSEMERYLKKTCQKNKISKTLLKKKSETTILEIKG